MTNIIWVRYLSCGCKRSTQLLNVIGVPTRPEVGDDCYCRNCMTTEKVERVTAASEEEARELEDNRYKLLKQIIKEGSERYKGTGLTEDEEY